MVDLAWKHVIVAGISLVLVRPLAGWLSLTSTSLSPQDRGVVAIYGVRGIGSIYYLAYAAGHTDLTDLSDLWIITAIAIFASTILHGFTVGWAMEKIDR
jgi:NhaP-type Na+/H+ or K+/H+ antiporter